MDFTYEKRGTICLQSSSDLQLMFALFAGEIVPKRARHSRTDSMSTRSGPEKHMPPLGFIAIELDIHRPCGDPYNEQTWPFPIIRLAAQIPVPVATSSLAQLPAILPLLPPTKRVGVLTYDETRLGWQHLKSFVSEPLLSRITIRGVPSDGKLRMTIEEGTPYVRADIEAELVVVAKNLVATEPDVAVLVLECTNMPPFADAIFNALGRRIPVYDVYTMGCWFYSGLTRQTPSYWVSP